MACGDTSEQIRIIKMEHTAPTGEGERYVTDAGRTWRKATIHDDPNSGDVRGVIIGDRIYQK